MLLPLHSQLPLYRVYTPAFQQLHLSGDSTHIKTLRDNGHGQAFTNSRILAHLPVANRTIVHEFVGGPQLMYLLTENLIRPEVPMQFSRVFHWTTVQQTLL